jgi:hypothetical protein
MELIQKPGRPNPKRVIYIRKTAEELMQNQADQRFMSVTKGRSFVEISVSTNTEQRCLTSRGRLVH